MRDESFAKRVRKTEEIVGAVCLYSMVFIVAGLVGTICL